MKNNILFITWDGPQTTYMEGLFMPIFEQMSKTEAISFHVIQFTWGNVRRTSVTKIKAEALAIKYTAYPISRKPIVMLGSLITLVKGTNFLKRYINKYSIDIVMPRSTMPSIMVNRIYSKKYKILFDADGLAIEERVDFSGLSKKSLLYKFLKAEETKILKNAGKVITRSQMSINFHIQEIGEYYRNKFGVVYNGRNTDVFKPNLGLRQEIRIKLDIKNSEKVFVYCGSLGPQYGWEEMLTIFKEYLKINKKSKFLILTGSPEFAHKNTSKELIDKTIVKNVPFEEVPMYLNIADIAFAIREPKPSMQGVAPIKLGEYLLMGLPTIASAGIGDTETILKNIPNCYLFQHEDKNNIKNTLRFLQSALEDNEDKRDEIRSFGKKYFSIEKSAESYKHALKKLM